MLFDFLQSFHPVRNCMIRSNQETGGRWKNWSENVWYEGALYWNNYIKFPKTEEDLRDVLADANEKGIKVRASGQRHSQPPQIVEDDRSGVYWLKFCGNFGKPMKQFVVDMSFYKDIEPDEEGGPQGMKVISVDEDKREAVVVVNAGIREDEFLYFISQRNLATKTVTAGGIFSIGGMTSNDVHGATLASGIFAETCEGFRIMKWDGSILEVHESDPVRPDGFHPIQFARVNLGLLGIVTRVFVKCDFRPKQESLQARISYVDTTIEAEFVNNCLDFLSHDRVEIFYDPYTGGLLPLMWDLTDEYDETGTPNIPTPPDMDTEEHAMRKLYGGKLVGVIYQWGGPKALIQNLFQDTATEAQYTRKTDFGKLLTNAAFATISEFQIKSAFRLYSESWLGASVRVIFMSYFIEIPDLGETGLKETYSQLKFVSDIVKKEGTGEDNFHTAFPMEFRFMKGGNSIMAGTYSNDPNAVFVNFDLLVNVGTGKRKKNPKNYTDRLLRFLATVEREWYNAGGLPHQGKMYGFFDPTEDKDHFCPPFNDNYIQKLNERRDQCAPGGRKAFNQYRKEMDPNDMFLNKYMEKLTADVGKSLKTKQYVPAESAI